MSTQGEDPRASSLRFQMPVALNIPFNMVHHSGNKACETSSKPIFCVKVKVEYPEFATKQ